MIAATLGPPPLKTAAGPAHVFEMRATKRLVVVGRATEHLARAAATTVRVH